MENNIKDRRSFFKKSFALIAGIGFGSFFYTIYRFFSPDTIKIPSNSSYSGIFNTENNKPGQSKGGLRPVKRPDGSYEIEPGDIPTGNSVIVSLSGIPVIITKTESNIRAFNATCSHLGCMVKWDNASQNFVCPCHGGKYDRDGKVLAGPPPSSLREHKVSVDGNSVKILIA